MTITESFKLLWEQQSRKQKWLLGIIGTVILFLMVIGWIDSAYSNYQVRKAEREATKAKFEANEALLKAAKIATEIAKKEFELNELEKKRNEKRTELEKAKRETADAAADYDRAVREPLSETPSADELCADLAKLGYPCPRR